MATVRPELDIGASLLGLYNDRPYVKKLGYADNEMSRRTLLRVVINYTDDDDDESFDNSMESIRKAGEFGDMMPARMRDEYEVVPIVASPHEGGPVAFWHDSGGNRQARRRRRAGGTGTRWRPRQTEHGRAVREVLTRG